MEFRYTDLSFFIFSLFSKTGKFYSFILSTLYCSLSLKIIVSIYYLHYPFLLKSLSDYFLKSLFKEKMLITGSNYKTFIILNYRQYAQKKINYDVNEWFTKILNQMAKCKYIAL